MRNYFDYIIVGGGSAGCTLAARLSEEKNIKVCLIEAGGSGRDLFIRMPAGNGFVFGNPDLDWGFQSTPQKKLYGRSIYLPRGKGLGGSSNMNGMIYMRGVPADYDSWKKNGLRGWSYSDILPYFKKSEGSKYRNDKWHGKDGPLATEPSVNFGTLEKAFINAAMKAGHTFLEDFNGPSRTGVGRTESMIRSGIRQSSNIAYLQKKPPNLKIIKNCRIGKVILTGNKAQGVETTDGIEFFSSKEVILCQGAFGSPHSLMLSGIGPEEHLQKFKIPVKIDLPGVGQNLADHVNVSMQYASNRRDLSLARYQRLDKAFSLIAQWLLFKSGPGSGAFFSATLFHAFRDANLPELQAYMTPMIIDENLTKGDAEVTPFLDRVGRKFFARGRKVAKPGIQIDINQMRPRSFGSVRLKSNNPSDYPLINPNYFEHEGDLEEIMQGIVVMREIMSKKEISQYHLGELQPFNGAKTNRAIKDAILQSTYSGHHPCCTARMGSDSDKLAVLDEDLKVRGVDNLRVCDASSFPTQITGNLNATVIAFAEKTADIILGKKPLAAQ